MQYKKNIQLKLSSILILWAFILTGCGGAFKAAQHPDDSFEQGVGLQSPSDFHRYVQSQEQDPQFRKARVTTHSSALRLKTSPEATAPGPSSGRRLLNKGDQVSVFWPVDVVNNHIKVYVDNQTRWVTHKSRHGQIYITLLEDIYLPETPVRNSGVLTPPKREVIRDDHKHNLKTIHLSSRAIKSAYEAIQSVQLESQDVTACQFSPLVGNNAGNNCYKKIVISKDFRQFISQHARSCAINAGKAAFGRTASKILFHTAGGGQVNKNRRVGRSGKRSTHSTGQAFDLFAVSLYFGQEKQQVKMHRSHTDGSSAKERRNHTFYWSFANCWRKRVKNHAACPCSDSRAGALTYLDNSSHYNHLHMSLPICERKRFRVACI